MSEVIEAIINYPFMQRALIAGLLVSAASALLGVTLVLKRYSMIGDGLSHVAFGALAIATALNMAPMQFTMPIVVITAVLLLRMNEKSKVRGDSAIALISTGALAVGVTAVSLSKGMNADVYNYMFGSILAMSRSDVILSVAVSVIIMVMFAVFYNRIFAVTFDEGFAQATGTRTGVYNMLIAVLTAVTIVVGMRMMGAMLISALVIFPALTSMRLFKTFKSVTVCSLIVSVVCFTAGLCISYIYNLPTGASIVIVNIISFALFSFIGAVKGK